GNDERAIKAYRQARELDAAALPPLGGLAALLLKKGEHAEAGRLYDELLLHHGDGMSPADRLDLYLRQAAIQRQLGQLDAAIEFYEKALTIEPQHRAALSALVELYGARARFAEVVAKKRALAALAEGDGRGRLLEELGDRLRG